MCLFVRLFGRFCPIQTSLDLERFREAVVRFHHDEEREQRTSSDVAEEPAAAQGRGSGSGRLRSVSDETFNVADEPRPPPQTAAAA